MRNFLPLLMICFSSILAQAQDSNNELLKKLVEKNVLTPAEANQIANEAGSSTKKSQNQFNESVTKVREAFNSPYMNFSGYGLLTYKYSEYNTNHHDLRPRGINLSINGKLSKVFGYGVQAELVNPVILDFYGEWTPTSYFSLKVGQYKVPFTLENSIALRKLETIYNSRSISNLAGMGDDVIALRNKSNGSGTGRDIGVQVLGTLISRNGYNLIEYSAGIFQGSSINVVDYNNNKDFSGMIMFQPIKGFRIGGGAYFGEASYMAPSETEFTDHVRNRWVASTDYTSNRFEARGEWIHGNDGGTEKEGLYGTALYFLIPKKLNIAGKVDYFNKDKKTNSEVIDYTCALNYYFVPDCRIQLNYTYSDFSKKWGGKNSNMVAAQMQIVF